MQVGWSELKSFVDAKGLSIQYVELSSRYMLAALDGTFSLTSEINKSSDDASDFETNYKANGNKPLKQRSITNLGDDDTFSLEAIGMVFTATKDSTTDHDLLLDKAYALKGGMLYSDNLLIGDHMKVRIVDVDNVLGAGPGFVVSEYIKKWYLMPGVPLVINNEFVGLMPAPGLYVRVSYTSTSTTVDPKVILNMYTYKVS